MLKKFPAWKYWTLGILFVLGLVYSLPNIFGESPAVQILPTTGFVFTPESVALIKTTLQEAQIPYKDIKHETNSYLITFGDTNSQIRANDILKEKLGERYIVALNLAPNTPSWLAALGAHPMKLGLDLRGGVHFLIEVDTDSAIQRRVEGLMSDIRSELKTDRIRYRQMVKTSPTEVKISFDNEETLDKAQTKLLNRFHEFTMIANKDGQPQLHFALTPASIQEIRNYTIEQTISTLRNRVNELGVAESVVQRQGLNHIVVELPGVQDTARAKDILGKTATLEFLLHADEESQTATPPNAPPGTKWYYDREGKPSLLKKRVILTGESITGASVGADDRSGRPAVLVRVGGSGLALFKKTTLENIGHLLAVVYIESKPIQEEVNGQIVKKNKVNEMLISIATIQSALGSNFQITGLTLAEAQDLSLLLRAGALPATISIVEERTIGPSLGQDNIRLGILSIEVGLGLVVLAMLLYYSVFGIIANVALVLNVVLLIALLSVVGATLTLPGMAAIVLTVGMAVDANVLIFERIREEFRGGMSPYAAIHSGFERALTTIIDANLTTLIVGVILFGIGTGPIKGFAITLCLGIITSMITATTGTRAIVNLVYGGRKIDRLRIGI